VVSLRSVFSIKIVSRPRRRPRRRPRSRNRKIEFVKPVAKQIEDDEEVVDIPAVFSISYSLYETSLFKYMTDRVNRG
jgi:hypothetical protein